MCSKKPYCNHEVDKCIQKFIIRINKYSKYCTLSSCCGHNKYPMSIIIQNKETKEISELFTKFKFEKRKRTFYKKDKEGYYFIPELHLQKANY